MIIKTHEIGKTKIAEVSSEETIINNATDGLDLLGNIYYNGFDKVVLHQKNFHPDFFELRTGLAGEILQKFSNYGLQLVIVGDFSLYESKSLRDFIYESNKGDTVNFYSSTAEVLK
ncbi:DUF4180 domain-containing protein [Membranihabitans marinus]|uniref:DUF4180 domain-containing protein n=1 Tax=Membranihabitans marinus TaxID=1227546 RepID=UPI001F226EA0|nr:DUF4180 domain-containing protein [Membranihabitans marinus]